MLREITTYPKILHTSDLHLSEVKPETIDALDKILQLAKENEVDLVTIAGDIFDTVEDAEALRPTLRSKLSNLDFEIIAIPGNHDIESYSGNLNFGSSLTLAARANDVYRKCPFNGSWFQWMRNLVLLWEVAKNKRTHPSICFNLRRLR